MPRASMGFDAEHLKGAIYMKHNIHYQTLCVLVKNSQLTVWNCPVRAMRSRLSRGSLSGVDERLEAVRHHAYSPEKFLGLGG